MRRKFWGLFLIVLGLAVGLGIGNPYFRGWALRSLGDLQLPQASEPGQGRPEPEREEKGVTREEFEARMRGLTEELKASREERAPTQVQVAPTLDLAPKQERPNRRAEAQKELEEVRRQMVFLRGREQALRAELRALE